MHHKRYRSSLCIHKTAPTPTRRQHRGPGRENNALRLHVLQSPPPPRVRAMFYMSSQRSYNHRLCRGVRCRVTWYTILLCMLCFGGGKSCPVVETETTSETGAVLQGGREQRGTRGETLTLVFFLLFFFLFLRLLAICPWQLEWTWLHMAWLGRWTITWLGLQERERERERKTAGGGGMSEGVMNTCKGPKWQFEELWPYRLQDM